METDIVLELEEHDYDMFADVYKCSACKAKTLVESNSKPPRYCSGCGKEDKDNHFQ